MRTYINCKSENNDTFQTILVKHKWEKKHGYAVGVNPDFVLFNSRWHRIRSVYISSKPYAYLRYYIGKKSQSDKYIVNIEY